jgi:hypothetical protein
MQRLFGRFAAYFFGGGALPPGGVTPAATPRTADAVPIAPLVVRMWDHWVNKSSRRLLGEERTQDLLVIGFCAAFSLIGWLMVLQGYEQLREARAVERWPTASGSIVAVDVQALDGREGLRWRPQVTYAYTVQGRLVTATRIGSGKAPNIGDEIQARDYVRRYLPQTPVKVHYNPAEITESVLEPGTPRSAHLNLAFGAGLAALGPALFLLIGLPAARRRRSPRTPAPAPAAP